MRLMHTKLPEFIDKMHSAAAKSQPPKKLRLKGLENLEYAKMQSLRTGRIEEAVEEISMLDDVADVELVVIPRIPETMHTVIIKGIRADGSPGKAIMDVVNILHPTEEAELDGFTDIEDRRPPIGRH